MKQLPFFIRDELLQKLDEIYNHRKQKEGLVSLHNCLCNKIYKIIVDWADKESKDIERVSKIGVVKNEKRK